MFRSVFTKYFAMTTAVITLCMVILGAVLLQFASNYWSDQERERLSLTAQQASSLLSNYERVLDEELDENGQVQWWLKLDDVTRVSIKAIARSLGANIYFVNLAGKVQNLALADRKLAAQDGVVMPDSILNKTIETGEFYELGNLDGTFPQTCYTAAVPVTVRTFGLVGIVCVSSSAGNLSQYVVDMLKMFLLSAVVVMIISFILVYVISYQMVKPLRQMAIAAKRFGEGDFSYRVPVRGKDEISELSKAFNQMAASLASVEGMRRSFVANVSHELRTPMTTIAGFIDGILDGTIEPDRRRQYLQTVSDEVKRLSRLVKEMLDVSRIEAGELKLNISNFDICDIMLRILFSFEQIIDQKGIEIRGLEETHSIMVEADADRIHQVIYNLVDNAIKFTNPGGAITLGARVESERVYVTVHNTGKGIALSDLPHVFDRFYKSDKSRSLDRKGVGLGLFIVRMLIQAHGGEIVARSMEGQYAEFEFWIPAPKKKQLKSAQENR
ncbi:sensor histidine kinase [Solibaculum mannosilyticum]|uniref:histidine kinase n=1 Tax=Solibaculum mannosilyticum TaxID=2780922 RepID=A0A7I8D6L6_9FIRM|nr:HAMP domain-containing sensor histidine kinase [Solibaculum mannosilyticum]BCI61372.1 two-component sensor histidine kinase [Solibaculum mannosilyticum]CZT56892.1 Sensor protein SrrB [Eubacteriaceae bacterium CHKCI005]